MSPAIGRLLLVASLLGLLTACGGSGEVTGGEARQSVNVQVCVKGQVRGCISELGGCMQQTCLGNSQGWSTCEPVIAAQAEVCRNGLDDDCNGQVDDGCDPCVPGTVTTCVTACGSTGVGNCSVKGELDSCVPPKEACANGIDDDCDGQIDEGCGCVPGTVVACQTGCGTTGTQSCTGVGELGDCVPPQEICDNGVDDDCDGLVDEGCAGCTPGHVRSCTAACGSTGWQSCNGVGEFDSCLPPAEACDNGVDDDCDGQVDEGCPECTPGQVRECTASCGTVGRQTCNGVGEFGSCVPPAEACDNQIDDDCDGQVDEGCPECTPGTVRQCTTPCGTTGWKTCNGVGEFDSCEPPKEDCWNGKDDDCDGKADELDPECENCAETEGHSCNGDDGHGDHCDASENEGCAPAKFWAWCNRRNPAYPDIWDNYIRDWVADRCDGSVEITSDQYPFWHCTDSTGMTYYCQTPLVLAFDPASPVSFVPAGHGFRLDPLVAARTDWPTAATPWLALDRDGNGRIDSGAELFGSSTVLPGGRRAVNGFEALAALDSNGDRRLDRRDASFARLVLWRDANADGLSQAGELQPLAAAGVASLGLDFQVRPRCDARGNCERERAAFSWTDRSGARHQGALIDVWMRAWPEPVAVASAEELVCR